MFDVVCFCAWMEEEKAAGSDIRACGETLNKKKQLHIPDLFVYEDMEAVSSPMVSATKLPVLNLVNDESPPPKRIVDGVEQTYPPTTTEEKLAMKNELKTLMEAIEKRFGGNKESKKSQKTLLKQQYVNFNGSSSKGLDQTYDRLQKLTSQLEILGETISQEDVNLNFLRSLPS
ncbi:hypothetical protein Tco_0452721 [Tanacetum coccineum]